MAATIAAAKACARTMLFDSLKIHKFQGAIPHVVLLVDSVPCVQQKVLVEGYRQVLEEFNGRTARPTAEEASAGTLFVPLTPGAETQAGSSGLEGRDTKISYSVQPFHAEHFMDDVKQLQRVLRHCGDARLVAQLSDGANGAAPSSASVWPSDRFRSEVGRVWPVMRAVSEPAVVDVDERFTQALHEGPLRELLGFILIQRNAFQNDMKKYRVRLSLFDLGMRVVEHCHLESMSEAADACAARGDYAGALADDQVYSYARSCAFSPHVAHSLAKAIADTIDAHAWARDAADPQEIPVPPSLQAAMHSEVITSLFKDGSLVLHNEKSTAAITKNGADDASTAAAAAAATAFQQWLQRPITQAGAPLQVVCQDPDKVLTFGGGLEDCLMNTGYYPAADDAERNDVVAHRARFRVTEEPTSEAAVATSAGGSGGGGEGEQDDRAKAEEVHGRLKKKDYLALLKQRGEKPNKKRPHESDDDDEGATTVRGATMSSSIGGTFPIGEVISESFDLSGLNGTCDVFAYPDPFKRVAMSKPRPFTMTIEKGIVTKVSADAPDDFVDLLSLVRQTEGDCYVRELGIGLNPYVGMSHVLMDVTSFERQWGIHLSLGQRHPLFVKQRARRNADGTVAEGVQVEGPVLKRKAGKYHIDVFLTASKLTIGSLVLDFTRGLAVV